MVICDIQNALYYRQSTFTDCSIKIFINLHTKKIADEQGHNISAMHKCNERIHLWMIFAMTFSGDFMMSQNKMAVVMWRLSVGNH